MHASTGTAASPSPSATGAVFNLQGYAIHDGPGIRTTVFLKGCPLRCAWCQNPESQRAGPEPFFDAARCTGCGACVAACPHEARSLVGQALTAEQVFAQLRGDEVFFRRSGGGVTLSGGEPLQQPGFAAELLARCRAAGIHTALDTCGHAPWRSVARVMAHVDLVLYDFKHMDPKAHRRLTGVTNTLILRNAERIHHEMKRPMQARVPIIPGHNDSPANLRATARFIAERLSPAVPVRLHAYHRFGMAKHHRLERLPPVFDTGEPDTPRLHEIRRTFEAFGLATQIGGG